jgi:Flp pilus assembly protein TadB
MVSVMSLWLAILLSAIAVFVVSSILHMVLPIHRKDYGKMPNEAGVMAAMRDAGVAPGDYSFPCPESPKDMRSPEMLEKYRQGPVGVMNVIPTGPPAMGKSLVQWFIFSVVAGVFVAYITGRTVGAGADYLAVFRVAGATGFLAYGIGHVHQSIWQGQAWSTSFKFVFDGLVYGLVTAGVFGWLWP